MPRSTETVLNVDDEPDLLVLTTAHLQSLGYNVLSASNGLDALSLLQHNPNIYLLLTDKAELANSVRQKLDTQAT